MVRLGSWSPWSPRGTRETHLQSVFNLSVYSSDGPLRYPTLCAKNAVKFRDMVYTLLGCCFSAIKRSTIVERLIAGSISRTRVAQ